MRGMPLLGKVNLWLGCKWWWVQMMIIPRPRLVISKLGTSKPFLIDSGSKCECWQQSFCGMLSPDDSGKRKTSDLVAKASTEKVLCWRANCSHSPTAGGGLVSGTDTRNCSWFMFFKNTISAAWLPGCSVRSLVIPSNGDSPGQWWITKWEKMLFLVLQMTH